MLRLFTDSERRDFRDVVMNSYAGVVRHTSMTLWMGWIYTLQWGHCFCCFSANIVIMLRSHLHVLQDLTSLVHHGEARHNLSNEADNLLLLFEEYASGSRNDEFDIDNNPDFFLYSF